MTFKYTYCRIRLSHSLLFCPKRTRAWERDGPWSNRDLMQAGRQCDDGGHLVKTSYCKESLSSITHHTKSIQLKREQWMASRF